MKNSNSILPENKSAVATDIEIKLRASTKYGSWYCVHFGELIQVAMLSTFSGTEEELGDMDRDEEGDVNWTTVEDVTDDFLDDINELLGTDLTIERNFPQCIQFNEEVTLYDEIKSTLVEERDLYISEFKLEDSTARLEKSVRVKYSARKYLHVKYQSLTTPKKDDLVKEDIFSEYSTFILTVEEAKKLRIALGIYIELNS